MTLNVTIKNTSSNGKQASVIATDIYGGEDEFGIRILKEHNHKEIIIAGGAEVEFVITDTRHLTVKEV